MLNVYISSALREDIKDTVKLANELGANIEICKFSESEILDNNLEATVNIFKDAFTELNGSLSMHGAFYDINPVSKDTKVKELSIYRYTQSLNIAKALGAKVIVFHTAYNALVKTPSYNNKFLDDQIKFWTEFIKPFEDAGIKAALENTYEDNPDIIISILDNVNSPNLRACIDTGHVNINSSLSVSDWVIQTSKHLEHMHIHNNNGLYDEHCSLENGTLDFSEIFRTLLDNNLNPNMTLEISKEEASLKSFEFIKKEYKKLLQKG